MKISERIIKISESSLSRVYAQTKQHDSGTISAFRSKYECNDGDAISLKENKNRSKKLKSKLLSLGYGVTKVEGTYIENFGTDNQIEVKEDSYLVLDLKDSNNLKKDLIKLGELFEQDSITFQDHSAGEYFIVSSNKCEHGYPGHGKIGVELKLGKPIFGKDGEFHSKVSGRPFVFESFDNKLDVLTNYYPTEIRSIKALANS